MTSRERVRRAIQFASPDRAPYFHRFLSATRERYGRFITDIEKQYPDDLADCGWQKPPSTTLVDGSFQNRDEWGCVRGTGVEGLAGIPIGHPLSDWKALKTYRWPDYSAIGGGWTTAPDILRKYPDKYHWGIVPGLNLFERMQALRGCESLLVDLGLRTREVYALRDRVVEIMLNAVHHWLPTEVDTIAFGDDWGTQNSLMISPSLWQEFFRPAYETLFGPVKQAGKFVQLHSCGMVLSIIPDLIDLGVDIINVQHTLIGLRELKKFRGQVCFLTQMDGQRILPHGSPADVRQHVRETFENLGGPAGGIIGYACVGPDVPRENIDALYQSYVDFGC